MPTSKILKFLCALSVVGLSATTLFFINHSLVLADVAATGYATAVVSNPSSDLTDFTLMIDLSSLPNDWWSAVNTSDGTKGRVTKNNGTELAADWIEFDSTNHTGWVRVLWSGTLASSGTQILKLYPPMSANSSYGLDDQYGGHDAYDTYWRGYWPDGGGTDRTTYENNGTAGASITIGDSSGPVGLATHFTGATDSRITLANNSSLNIAGNITVLTLAKPTLISSYGVMVGGWSDTSPYPGYGLSAANNNSFASWNGSSFSTAPSNVWTTGSWYQVGYVNDNSADTYYVNGASVSSNSSRVNPTSYSGARALGSTPTGLHLYSGYLQQIEVHAINRSAAWIAEEYAQLNSNESFWGSWTWNSGLIGNPSVPSLISPTNNSATANDLPTLSAQYADDDNVGSTLYRIASTNADDCLAGLNLVASGTSAQTATNNEETTFTPVSSLGTDGTYYWCAQNNDGTNASDWTSMGSFILDTNSPSRPGTPTTQTNSADNTPTWSWSTSTDSGSGLNSLIPYVVEWSEDENFSSGVASGTATTNTFTNQTSLADGTWYFRVAAKDAAGNKSAFSAPGSITIDTAAIPNFSVNYLSTDADGIQSYSMTSNYNGGGAQTLRILTPDQPASDRPHNFLYVLPVDPGLSTTYGDGLAELKSANVQNEYNVTIIAPAFSLSPWYADSDSNNNYRYESFMVSELQPWVKKNLAETGDEQHWLLGFSKSGYGPMHLLFRHPDKFTLGAFWDFPADMSAYDTYSSSAANYGSQTNFDANYRLSSSFLDNHKTPFLDDNRIWINGYGNFKTDVEDFDALLSSKNIKHTTAPEVSRTHSWGSGWIPSAVAGLYTNSQLSSGAITTQDSTDSNWHNTDLDINLTCVDSLGSGCAHTYYTTDGSTPETSSAQGTKISLSASGTYTIKYFSVNNIGLRETVQTATNTVKIDKQAPEVSAGDDKSTETVFTQTATVSDSLSGINPASYHWAQTSGPGVLTFGSSTALATTISADTNGTYGINFTVSDEAGNSNNDNFVLTWGTVSSTTYTITTSFDSHGTMSPTGPITVGQGSNQLVTITAFAGYRIADVLVDGLSVGAVSSYQFDNITQSHTITAKFAARSTGGSGGGSSSVSTTKANNSKLYINQNTSTTTSRTVTLYFNAGSDITKMSISMRSDFRDTIPEIYQSTKQWDLCSSFEGLIKSSSCPLGVYTVYARFYNAAGEVIMPVASSSITLTTETGIMSNLGNFMQDLKLGQTSTEVKKLQIMLNSDSTTSLDGIGAGSSGQETTFFGALTRQAVIKFQEKYRSEILTPLGLEHGTGIVGPSTRAKLNQLLGS